MRLNDSNVHKKKISNLVHLCRVQSNELLNTDGSSKLRKRWCLGNSNGANFSMCCALIHVFLDLCFSIDALVRTKAYKFNLCWPPMLTSHLITVSLADHWQYLLTITESISKRYISQQITYYILIACCNTIYTLLTLSEYSKKRILSITLTASS